MSTTKSTAIWLGAAVLLIASGQFLYPHDDTDPPDERSGLVPYTDYKTGCQYLRAGSIFGVALTPRMGADGRQICGKSLAQQSGSVDKVEVK